jgi:ketosteroid isomerase-like protein
VDTVVHGLPVLTFDGHHEWCGSHDGEIAMKVSNLGLAIVFAVVGLPVGAQTPTTPERELLKLEDEWSQASIKRDGAALPRFYADEYLFTDEDGVVTDKAKEMKNLTTGVFRLESYKFDDMKVRVYGDVAIVTGRNTIKGMWDDIKRDVSGPYRFTDVFVRRDGRWQCVASQSSRIVQK